MVVVLKPAVLAPGRSCSNVCTSSPGNDECRRLQSVNQGVRIREVPIGVGFVPHAIEPDAADRPVVREQLGELLIHERDVACPVAAFRST